MKSPWIWLVVLWIGVDAWLARWWWERRREQRAEVHILGAARRYEMDPALVKAVVWRESRFHEDARGTSGEVGLMQVGALAAREWAEAEKMAGFQHLDLLDPARNALAGTWYLARLLRRYPQTDNPVAYALADYNAGRVNVLRWLKGPAATNSTAFLEAMDFPTTRRYVESVLERRAEYQGMFPRPGQ
ncbi:MAG: lytic transglycosylase domain-containing protein [Verrucomicrobiales bacterium]|nr:lytic transglycosylase domain-containing protein [Verrucomicrobiales bacterium]